MAATSSSCAGDNLFNSSLNDSRTLFIIYTAFDLFFYFFSISGGDLAFCLCHFITIFIYIFSCKFFLRCASYNFDKFLQCPFFFVLAKSGWGLLWLLPLYLLEIFMVQKAIKSYKSKKEKN